MYNPINTNVRPNTSLGLNGHATPDKPVVETVKKGNLAGAAPVALPLSDLSGGLSGATGKPTDYAPASGVDYQDPTQVNGAEARLSQAIEKLGGSTIDATELLAIVMVYLESAQRKESLDEVLDAHQQAKDAAMSKANDQRKEADDIKSGAIAALTCAAVSAAVSVGCAVATKGDSKLPLKQALDAVARLSGETGVGASAKGFLDASAKNHAADGSVHDADAQSANIRAEQAKATQSNLSDSMQKLIAFLKDMQAAKVEAMRAITRA